MARPSRLISSPFSFLALTEGERIGNLTCTSLLARRTNRAESSVCPFPVLYNLLFPVRPVKILQIVCHHRISEDCYA